ncbi:MAG: hypothetical protein LBR44_04305, partial [Clostridiales Family XIII bacterium]|nr:hypothetical protein [Clostridiales Family XIII bacterium]
MRPNPAFSGAFEWVTYGIPYVTHSNTVCECLILPPASAKSLAVQPVRLRFLPVHGTKSGIRKLFDLKASDLGAGKAEGRSRTRR